MPYPGFGSAWEVAGLPTLPAKSYMERRNHRFHSELMGKARSLLQSRDFAGNSAQMRVCFWPSPLEEWRAGGEAKFNQTASPALPAPTCSLFFNLFGSHLKAVKVIARVAKNSKTPGSQPNSDAKALAAPLLPTPAIFSVSSCILFHVLARMEKLRLHHPDNPEMAANGSIQPDCRKSPRISPKSTGTSKPIMLATPLAVSEYGRLIILLATSKQWRAGVKLQV